MLLVERFVNRSQHHLGCISTFLDIMAPIGQYLWLNYGHKPILLTNDCVASQPLSVLLDRKLRGFSRSNLKHSSPLGEPCTSLVKGCTTGTKPVKPLSGGLTVGASKVNHTLINLNTRKDIGL
ncbi:hypothetical protein HanHA300_Chr11g0395101 [Helianthus annuus]|nr:hypothetical protein HanHA300_Chr11g0395101 [Helianthus annuus]KAJ0516837.1 hypothetical protein HanHA89_Chr11g0418281 [Helianthus annuus]KAJ0684842.1 hypothetical protein HanLR1_Chr11g0395711 [Helianthus annuus]KAJ0688769.1 hypothetical protein HanOQP8_Chr11g0397951 [Helianthus annuus]